MRVLQKSIAGAVAGLLVMAVASCAATPVPQELLDARASYQRAQSGPAMQLKPDQLHEAKVALHKAEMSYLDEPRDQKTKDLAYLAHRKAELAEASAASAQAHGFEGQADADAKRTTKENLAEARGQLASANTLLTGRQRQLETEKKARVAADKRAKDALDHLTATPGTVKHEERGLVITLPGSILFASNNDAILPGAEERLGDIAEALKAQDDREIVVEGHTDSQGSAASNQGLSRRRARSVASFLISRGVPGDQIRTEGLGLTRPVADNGSAEGRANNRRVEIIVKPVDDH